MATEIDQCNSALDKLGVEPIGSFTDKTKAAALCSTLYNPIRQKLLRRHPWNFAQRRTTLLPEKFSFEDGDVNTGTDEITSAGHKKQTGDKVNIVNDGGELPAGLDPKDYFVIRVSGSVFKLANTFADSDSGTAIDITAAVSGGTHFVRSKPQWGDGFIFAWPKTALKITQVGIGHNTPHKVEKKTIVANTDELLIKYTDDVVDVDLFDEAFFEAFSYKMAEELAFPLFQNVSLASLMREKAKEEMGETKSDDAGEDTPDDWDDPNSWTASRVTGSTRRGFHGRSF